MCWRKGPLFVYHFQIIGSILPSEIQLLQCADTGAQETASVCKLLVIENI